MSSFAIKLVAIITMLIDHLGFFVFPQFVILRAIGRLSFPLFSWLIANGAKNTKNINKYLVRLLAFAGLSQIPFLLATRTAIPDYFGTNIFFQLSLGLLCIKFIEKKHSKFLTVLVIAIFALIAQLIKTEYGAIGVLSIVFFYLFFNNFGYTLISQIFLYFPIWYILLYFKVIPLNVLTLIQPLAFFSLIFVSFYNKKLGPKAKYLFYVIYPLQYVLFYIYKVFVS